MTKGNLTQAEALVMVTEWRARGVEVARVAEGLAAALAGGDVNTGADAGGNAAENNAFFIPAIIVIISAAYATGVGDGDPLEGLAVIGRGDDTLSQAMATATTEIIELSARHYPDQTIAVLSVLQATNNAIDATITYVDGATGKEVSTRWNRLDQRTREQLIGGGKILQIALPAASVKMIKDLKVARNSGSGVADGVPGGVNVAASPIVPGGGLQAHEAAGGHLISRHVGKSDADLGARLNAQPNITAASSFPDRATAERAISSALDDNTANISQFLNGTGGRLVINHNVGSTIGNVMSRGGGHDISAIVKRPRCYSARRKHADWLSDHHRVPSSMTESFVNLERLVAGYFHQDWDIEGASDADVILAFRRAEAAEQVEATISEVNQVLQLCAGEPLKADELLAGFGCEYYYHADDLTGISWLERVRSLLSSPDFQPPSG
ncbi:contact-dependent growth inhibition system immunity protein [Rhizobium sp. RU33A]|uniref:contact-dependent growth inhibition system immunity protein n=1 Tax=Rhizobium sp. RU33A TaxID=1907413 RepID=UPI0011156AEF|nr:contact-dependent growth inhibition system immunity protein [Rhizobium sp. RU33A]